MSSLEASFINLFDTKHNNATSWDHIGDQLNESDPAKWTAIELSPAAVERISWANRQAFGEAPELVALWNNAARLGNQKAGCMCRDTESYVPLQSSKQLQSLKNMRGIVAIVRKTDWEDRTK